MKRHIYHIFTLLILTVFHATNVEAYYYRLNINNGLPSNDIHFVAQDDKGYLWISTYFRMFRYDGNFFSELGNNSRLVNNWDSHPIRNMFYWRNGMMLVSHIDYTYSFFDTNHDSFISAESFQPQRSFRKFHFIGKDIWLRDHANGCARVYFSGGSVHATYYNKENGGLPVNDVNFITGDKKGNIFVSTAKGLFLVKGKKAVPVLKNVDIRKSFLIGGRLVFVSENGAVGYVDSNMRARYLKRQGLGEIINGTVNVGNKIVFLTHNRAIEYDTKTGSTKPSADIDAVNSTILSDDKGNEIIADKERHAWYVDNITGKVYKINIFDRTTPDKDMWRRRYSIVSTKDKIWASSWGDGITVIDKKTGKQTKIRKNDGSGIIDTDYILTINKDYQDNIWIVQEYLGLSCITSDKTLQHSVSLGAGHDEQASVIKCLKRLNDGSIWAANNVCELYRSSGSLKFNIVPETNGRQVLNVARDNNGLIAVATRNDGLIINGKIYSQENGKTSTDNIRALVFDRKGRLWAGGENSHLDVGTKGKDGEFHFRRILPKDCYNVLICDSKGNIWAGSQSGVYMFNPDQLLRNPKSFKHINKDSKGGKIINVYDIIEDSKHNFWAGTIGYGAFRIDRNYNITKELSTQNGLIANDVRSIIEAESGKIWMGTSNGICIYDTRHGNIEYLYGNDMQKNYCTDRSVCKLANGDIAYGTLGGIVSYSLRQKALAHVKTKDITITDIKVGGIFTQELGYDVSDGMAISTAKEIKLRHDDNSIVIAFSCFDYSNNEATKYRSWLENYDKEWGELTSIGSATYKNLPPGKYIFHVKAYTNDITKTKEKTLVIVIMSPWWATWWATLLYIIIGGGIVFFILRQVKQNLQLHRRLKMEHDLTMYKLRFFTDISHEFRTPLTIIKGSMDYINKIGDVPGNIRQPISSMAHSVERLTRLINQLLTFRKLQNNKMKLSLRETDVILFIRNIFDNFIPLAQDKNIDYVFQVQEKSRRMFIDCDFVDKIIYNLLSNAFKYTPNGGSITLRAKFDSDMIHVSIEDSGIGVSKEKQKEIFMRFATGGVAADSMGIGLNLASELAKIHHGRIDFRENTPSGSIFTLSLPLDKGVYNDDDFAVARQITETEDTKNVHTFKEMAADPLNQENVLVVEDDNDVRSYLKMLLGHYFNIITANDGVEALSWLESNKASLVVTDAMMPVLNGFELTKRIRANVKLKHLPIIMLTALADDQKLLKGLHAGVDAYISKPFNNDVLIATCIRLVERQRMDSAPKEDSSAKKNERQRQQMPKLISDKREAKFIDILNYAIDSNIGNNEMNVEFLANYMKMGRTVFYRKVKELTGYTPNEYITKKRMAYAVKLFEDPVMSISQIAYESGYSDPKYFSLAFKKYFGVSPNKFRTNKIDDNTKDKDQE